MQSVHTHAVTTLACTLTPERPLRRALSSGHYGRGRAEAVRLVYAERLVGRGRAARLAAPCLRVRRQREHHGAVELSLIHI